MGFLKVRFSKSRAIKLLISSLKAFTPSVICINRTKLYPINTRLTSPNTFFFLFAGSSLLTRAYFLFPDLPFPIAIGTLLWSGILRIWFIRCNAIFYCSHCRVPFNKISLPFSFSKKILPCSPSPFWRGLG